MIFNTEESSKAVAVPPLMVVAAEVLRDAATMGITAVLGDLTQPLPPTELQRRLRVIAMDEALTSWLARGAPTVRQREAICTRGLRRVGMMARSGWWLGGG